MRTLHRWSSALLALIVMGCGGAQSGPTSSESGPADGAAPPTAASGEKSSGPKAPDFTLTSLDGEEVRLSDHRDSVVLIDFWSTSCDPCMVEIPHLVRMYKKHKDKGFVVLAVSLDGPETRAQVSSVVHDKEMVFPVLLDEETTVVGKFNPKNELPYAVLINRRGEIVHHRGGYTPGDEAALEDEVERLLAE
jgi:peroxiredoxin